MAIDLRRFGRHGFDWAVKRLEQESPRLLGRAEVLPVSVFEIFMHHEDLLRTNDIARQSPVPDLFPCISSNTSADCPADWVSSS